MNARPSQQTSAGNQPYCSHCGYDLTNLTESSRCPECGRPLVEVLARRGSPWMNTGKRYRSKARLFGLPVIDVAIGPRDGELRGKAKGIIAIGDIATGLLAVGGVARGLVACGGVALGGFSFGGLSVGLLCALGGVAIGGFASGGGAAGGVASGGAAVGFVAQGGGAYGYYARGGGVGGMHVITPVSADPAAVEFFDRYAWLLGGSDMSQLSLLNQAAVPIAATLAVAVAISLLALFAMRREPE